MKNKILASLLVLIATVGLFTAEKRLPQTVCLQQINGFYAKSQPVIKVGSKLADISNADFCITNTDHTTYIEHKNFYISKQYCCYHYLSYQKTYDVMRN